MAQQDKNQTEIRKVFDTLSDAARRRDLSTLMSCYAKDVVAFDVMPPLVVRGAESYRKNWELGFAMSEGPFNLEFQDMTIASSGDVAFVHTLEHCATTDKKEGKNIDMWMRMTAGLKKIDGTWKIVHQQDSVPVDMTTDRPIWDLKPEGKT
jgi:uncharacterized protein (TIGR02246 family)